MLDHRSLPLVLESRRGHIWRVFHLWFRFINFGGRSAHLAYHVHKIGRKTSIIIIIIIQESTIIYVTRLIQIHVHQLKLLHNYVSIVEKYTDPYIYYIHVCSLNVDLAVLQTLSVHQMDQMTSKYNEAKWKMKHPSGITQPKFQPRF